MPTLEEQHQIHRTPCTTVLPSANGHELVHTDLRILRGTPLLLHRSCQTNTESLQVRTCSWYSLARTRPRKIQRWSLGIPGS